MDQSFHKLNFLYEIFCTLYVFIEHKYINKLNRLRLLSNKTVSGEAVSNEPMSDNTVSDGNRVGNGNGASHGMGNRMGNSVADHSVSNTDNIRVSGSAVVGDLGDVASGIVGVVVHVLDAAVGKVDRVGAVPHTGAIVRLSLLESGAGVVIVDAVLVGVGGNLGKIVVADSVGDGVVDGVSDRVCHCVHHGCSNCHSMADTVADQTMAKTVAKELGGRRSGGGKGSDAQEVLMG